MTTATLLAVSHGTSSPTGAAAVAALVRAVADADGAPRVAEAFVDVQQPDVPTTLGELGTGAPVVVVPLLLSAGFHVHVDLREAADEARAAGQEVRIAAAMGPDERLVTVLARRLADAGLEEDDAVVLAAAGSSDARALGDCETVAKALSTELGRPVTLSYISAAKPRVAAAVATAREEGRRVVVASYLLAPGYFAELAAAAGGDATTAPLLTADGPVPPELVELVLDRYRAVLG